MICHAFPLFSHESPSFYETTMLLKVSSISYFFFVMLNHSLSCFSMLADISLLDGSFSSFSSSFIKFHHFCLLAFHFFITCCHFQAVSSFHHFIVFNQLSSFPIFLSMCHNVLLISIIFHHVSQCLVIFHVFYPRFVIIVLQMSKTLEESTCLSSSMFCGGGWGGCPPLLPPPPQPPPIPPNTSNHIPCPVLFFFKHMHAMICHRFFTCLCALWIT